MKKSKDKSIAVLRARVGVIFSFMLYSILWDLFMGQICAMTPKPICVINLASGLFLLHEL